MKSEWEYLDAIADQREEKQKLFDVTQVIGSVYASSYGNTDPHMVAMMLIAAHTTGGVSGTFQFPNEAGGMCIVTVRHTFEAEDAL